ncbi:hypothetical protein AMAG_09769 [Allomyces macrogynus ATCC 38327]|uniref:tRNA/rRNA methyltransferase SpoU type domain-containing protein n=1 Tax=Allomyces macrogynus (strain ATCC 38327) TaxID=578462 RepID=A0A0L0STD3_ALLM3|nr:hypothetical protein AMAG_09769 [Allomyces macrogynus ATCC 38327]|eukprot:KNE65793.1 hypothetical protein AMAG_09769 [Allomyces macrogynus ATCC 38327]
MSTDLLQSIIKLASTDDLLALLRDDVLRTRGDPSLLEKVNVLVEELLERVDQAVVDSLFKKFLQFRSGLKSLDDAQVKLVRAILTRFLLAHEDLVLELLAQQIEASQGLSFAAPVAFARPSWSRIPNHPTICTDLSEAISLLGAVVSSQPPSDVVFDALFGLARACATCLDRDVRLAAMHQIPVIMRSTKDQSCASRALTEIYATVVSMADHGVLRLECAQMLAALLPFLERATTPCIWSDDRIFRMLQTSLVLPDPSARKFALYCVKRLSDPAQQPPTAAKVLRSALFPAAVSQETWGQFFLLYETVAETYHHLIRPMFAALESHLVSSPLDRSWWLLALERGFQNDSVAARKQIIQFVLNVPHPVRRALAGERAFLNTLFTAAEWTPLYAVNVQGAFVSVFGELVAQFWAGMIAEDATLVETLLLPRLRETRSLVCLLFVTQGISQAAEHVRLSTAGFQALVQLTSHTSLNSPSVRELIEKLVLDTVTAQNPRAFPITTVFQSLANLTHLDHPQLDAWLAQLDLVAPVTTAVHALLNEPRHAQLARRESRWLAFLIARLPRAVQRTVLDAVCDLVGQVYTRPYLAPGVPEMRIIFMTELDVPDARQRVASEVVSYLWTRAIASPPVEFLEEFKRAIACFGPWMDAGRTAQQITSILTTRNAAVVEDQVAKVLAMSALVTLKLHDRVDAAVVRKAELQRPDGMRAGWNDLMAEFTTLKWQAIMGSAKTSADPALLDALADELESNHREHSVILMDALAAAISPSNVDLLQRVLSTAWGLVMENTSVPKLFGPLYRSFLRLLLQTKLFEAEKLTGLVCGYLAKIRDLSEVKLHTMSLALETLFPVLVNRPNITVRYLEPLVEWIMFGPLRDRDEDRIETVWMMKLGRDEGAFTDYSVRVHANVLALQLASTPALKEPTLDFFVRQLARAEMRPELEFPNQLVNRQKVRLLSTLLLVVPLIVTKTSALRYLEQFARLMDQETTMNVRQYYEWLLARIALEDPTACQSFLFAELHDYNTRSQKITSLLVVVGYMVQSLGRIGSPANIMSTAEAVFGVVTPWLATNHFTVRLHTQWVISRTWRICETFAKRDGAPAALKALLARQDLVALVKFIHTNRDSTKFRTKYIAANYLNNDFDPVDDWTLAFVFELFPTLSSETASDERVSARAFRRVLQGGGVKVDVGAGWPRVSAPERVFYLKESQMEDEAQPSHGADLVVDQTTGVVADLATNATPAKNNCKNKGKGNGDPKAPTPAQPETVQTTETGLVPVQRKITPWAAMMEPDFDLTSRTAVSAAEAVIYADQPTTGLGAVQNMIRSIPGAVGAGRAGRFQFIVCASLVEMATNLGGLCRTSEIFGLEALAVHSARIRDDPTFRALAVSADRHMPMVEAPRTQLADWLRTMKRDHHYTVVALEQTSASVALHKLPAFPTKMILLLGKEKEGVPADLLAAGDIVDLCIEIPQLGLTRSLNVHNSAAILIWEYVRRQLLSLNA